MERAGFGAVISDPRDRHWTQAESIALSVTVLTRLVLIPMDMVEYLFEQLSEFGGCVLRFHPCSNSGEFPLVGSKSQKVLIVDALWSFAIDRGVQLEQEQVLSERYCLMLWIASSKVAILVGRSTSMGTSVVSG